MGVYLGVHVDPETMFYAYHMTDGKNVNMLNQNIITTGDIFSHNITVPQDIEIVPKARLG